MINGLKSSVKQAQIIVDVNVAASIC